MQLYQSKRNANGNRTKTASFAACILCLLIGPGCVTSEPDAGLHERQAGESMQLPPASVPTVVAPGGVRSTRRPCDPSEIAAAKKSRDGSVRSSGQVAVGVGKPVGEGEPYVFSEFDCDP